MRTTLVFFLAAAAALMAGCPAHAGPLTIVPTTLEIEPQRHSAMLTVTNDSDQPVDLQFRAYAWTQPGGVDTLMPTGDLVISPAVVTVGPRRKQVFRILRVRTSQAGAEPSYRLRLNELPRPGGTGVRVNLEFSLPVFVSTKGAAPTLSWSREDATVSVINTGNRRVRLGGLALTDGTSAGATLVGAQSSYILAGAGKTFSLAPAGQRLPPTVRLVGITDHGRVDVASSPPPAR